MIGLNLYGLVSKFLSGGWFNKRNNRNSFLETWLNTRKENPKYSDLLGNGIAEELLKRYKNFDVYSNVSEYALAETYKDLGRYDSDLFQRNLYGADLDAKTMIGWTNYLKNMIFYPKNNPSILTHELTHALSPELQIDKIKQGLPNLKLYNPWIEETYYDLPEEIYSELMRLRLKLKLSPTKLYSIDEVKNLIKNSKESFHILDRRTPEEILYLINEVAMNGTHKSYEKQYAGKGSKLSPKAWGTRRI